MSTPRPHLGSGALSHQRELSVFINCPFDAEYRPLFDSLIIATICCGFMPRCAIETGTGSLPRIDRIASALRGSKYSIHDLSRCRGEGDVNLARFNMPLELGIAMGERLAQNGDGGAHDWLVLVPEGHEYQRFVSDLSGFDPSTHSGTPESIITEVMAWLATRPDAVQCPTPANVETALPRFRQRLEGLRASWNGRAPWPDTLHEIIEVAGAESLIPV